MIVLIGEQDGAPYVQLHELETILLRIVFLSMSCDLIRVLTIPVYQPVPNQDIELLSRF